MAAHLHQKAARAELLVVVAGAQGHGPGQGGIEGVQTLLDLAGQGQVFRPARVLLPGAHHQHNLGGLGAVDGGHGLIHRAVAGDEGVPVDVQHHPDGGILLQIARHRLPGAGVGPVVLGVVVESLVVEDLQPHLGEDGRHLLPHPDHVVVLVQGAAVAVAGGVDVLPVWGVGLGGVGVDDQDLGALLGRGEGEAHLPPGQVGQVHRQVGAVI